jgi:hypothetical protein
MKRNQMERALELLLVMLGHPASLQVTKKRVDRLRAELESRLTPTEIKAIQTHVGGKTFEAVIMELLRKSIA